MKKKIFYLIFLWLLIFTNPSFSSSIEYFDFSDEIISTLNHLRRNPSYYLTQLNIPISSIQGKWEGYDLSIMKELRYSEELTNMAKDHIEEMLNNGFIGHISTRGLTLEQRAELFGYNGILIGESISVIAFENFISPQQGLNTLLNSLIQNCLTQQSPEGAPLLFPLYQDVGVSFGGGVMEIDGRFYNVYILCIDFGLKDADGYFIGRVYKKDSLPLPESSIGGVDIYLWGKDEIFFAHHEKTLPDGTFFFPVSSKWWWVYINLSSEYTKIFQTSKFVDFIEIP